ncbi:MAG: hypothetical protein MUQ56_04985 [Thermoleophilia bacterium]|nr:hypothetical protein [Thermoleophilia bacterium]
MRPYETAPAAGFGDPALQTTLCVSAPPRLAPLGRCRSRKLSTVNCQLPLPPLRAGGFFEGDVNAAFGELEFAAFEEFFDGEELETRAKDVNTA